MLKIQDESESPGDGACLKYDGPEPPACLRYMMNRNRQMRGRV